MVSMLGMFRSFHVQIDLGRKEFLWRSVLGYIHLSFNGLCARVAAYMALAGGYIEQVPLTDPTLS